MAPVWSALAFFAATAYIGSLQVDAVPTGQINNNDQIVNEEHSAGPTWQDTNSLRPLASSSANNYPLIEQLPTGPIRRDHGSGLGVKPRVILKLDDLVNSPPVVNQFNHVKRIIVDENIKASFGVITRTIEGLGSDAYFCKWLRDVESTKAIEVWNHGLDHVRGEFNNSLKEQTDRLNRAQKLLKVCGIDAKSFGAPFNENNQFTGKALEGAGSFSSWYFPRDPGTTKLTTFPAFATRCDMEVSRAGEISYNHFRFNYARMSNQPVLVLQGHPGHWDTLRMTEFMRIITFLKAEGTTFITPTEWANEQPASHGQLKGVASADVSPGASSTSGNTTTQGLADEQQHFDNLNLDASADATSPTMTATSGTSNAVSATSTALTSYTTPPAPASQTAITTTTSQTRPVPTATATLPSASDSQSGSKFLDALSKALEAPKPTPPSTLPTASGAQNSIGWAEALESLATN